MPVPPGGKTAQDPKQADDQKEKGSAAPLPGSKKHHPQAVRRLSGHEGDKDPVHQNTPQQIAHRDGEKLQGVPGRVDPALNLRGELREGEALPSMRLLARDLRISVITTKRAYEELERDGFLHREVYQEIPPRVEYTLTDTGESFAPILHQMLAWSEEPEGWYLTLPGAEEGQPVTREMLEAMLPQEVQVGEETLPVAWDLTAFPEEGAWEGEYILTAAFGEEQIAVTAFLGGAEMYDVIVKYLNDWSFLAVNGSEIPENHLKITLTAATDQDALRQTLTGFLPQYIRASGWVDDNLRNAGFIQEGTSNYGKMPIVWDLTALPEQLELNTEYSIVASTKANEGYQVIVNSNNVDGPNSVDDPFLLTLRVTLEQVDLHLEDHIVTPANPAGVTVNLFDYWVHTDVRGEDDLLPKTDSHIGANNVNTGRTGVEDWNHGINENHLLIFGDGNIHAGFWNKGAGAASDYGKNNAGMMGIVENKLTDGYPTINTADMTKKTAGYEGISDWKLCGDHDPAAPSGYSSQAPQNISDGVISSWRNVWGSVENGASLDYLFSPDVKNDYKKSYTDVTGLFQLDDNGYYYYDMRRNFAEFREAKSEEEGNTFILYDAPAVDRTDLYNGHRSIGNFFPFNSAAEVFTGEKDGKLYSDETIQSNHAKGTFRGNHHLGMTLELNFRQPAGGMINMGTKGNQPMSFSKSWRARQAIDLMTTYGSLWTMCWCWILVGSTARFLVPSTLQPAR